MKSLFDFGDRDLIFKVILALCMICQILMFPRVIYWTKN